MYRRSSVDLGAMPSSKPSTSGQISAEMRSSEIISIADTAVKIEAGSFQIEFKTDEEGRLFILSCGAWNSAPGVDGWAYPPSGDGWVFEPALSVIHHDGNRSTDLRVECIEQEDHLTTIHLFDPLYAFFVKLKFKACPEYSLIEAWTEIQHNEPGEVTLEAFASSSLDLGTGDFHLTQFSGDWADEAHVIEEKINRGIKVIDSKLGVRAHQFTAPWLLVSKGPAQEESGEVIAGSLWWSGSFKFSAEKLPKNSVRLTAGINPFGSAIHLPADEVFATPKMTWAWSANGTGDLTRNLHRYVRNEVLREGSTERAILLNNWEATYFDFDEAKVISLFDGAKALGMELFLLDDGWFANKHPRNGDTQGLGDWEPNTEKLPNGIGILADKAQEKGLRFGLWFEPEMVNPKSSLFESHPDWVIKQPGRELELQRNQLTLDLSNPEVREFAYKVLASALTETPGISYVKWDCNRYLTQAGSTYLSAKNQTHLQVEYVRGLYEVMERLKAAHPEVEVMMCSGGGGRVDYAALSFAHEVWPSDMTDPCRRIFIQWGFSYFIPAIATAAHVTKWGERPFKFAFDVAMSCRLGMDVDAAKLSPEDHSFAKRAIQAYKQIREVVQMGDLYRLESPYSGPRAALQITLGDRSAVFVYASNGAPSQNLALKSLDPEASYRVREINRMDEEKDLGIICGKDLLTKGLAIGELNAFGSQVFEILPH